MGLYVQSLESLPRDTERDYYIYLLDYGWHEPLGEALFKNYDRMITEAEKANAVVISSKNRVHFEDQVLSWHNVNGQNTDEVLPAILITNRNPHRFKESYSAINSPGIEKDLKLILIPLQKFCSNTGDVARLIDGLFRDMIAGKQLSDFKVGKIIPKGGRALADAVLLEPSIEKQGIAVEKVIGFLKGGVQLNDSNFGTSKTVHPIHFEDFSGEQFERLVFAYVSRIKTWDTIEWLGQTGSDGGRDIWGVLNNETFCYQCANYKQLVLKKVINDIDKLIKFGTIPYCFTVICGGRISPDMRNKISAYAFNNGIKKVEVWSAVEFEEKVRRDHPTLLRRFIEGEEFPEIDTDVEFLKAINSFLDRPAFKTSIRKESSISDITVALVDTIAALNTGVHRLRDGTVVNKIYTRHEIKDQKIIEGIATITQKIINLRDELVQFVMNKEIKPCACNKANCSVWFFSENAVQVIEEIRKEIIEDFNRLYPASTISSVN